MLSTTLLIGTLKSAKIKSNQTEIFQNSHQAGGLLVTYLQRVEELNLGPPNTNPSSSRQEGGKFELGASGL